MTFVHRAWRVALVLGLVVVAGGVVVPVLAQGGAVSIDGLAFKPPTITVAAGDTVTWTVTQSIGAQHSVTSGTLSAAARSSGAAFAKNSFRICSPCWRAASAFAGPT